MPPASGASSSEQGWVARIAGMSDDELTRLLDARPDLRLPAPATREELGRRAITPASVWACFDYLDRSSRELLEAVCIFEPVGTDELGEALGVPGEALLSIVAKLSEAAMLDSDDALLSANPGLGALLRYPAGLGPPAATLLQGSTVPALREMASRLRARPGNSKGALIEAIGARLSDPATVLATVAAGPEGSKKLSERLATAPLLGVYGGVYDKSRSDATPEGWFLRRGLLVSQSWESAAVPREVGLALRGGKTHHGFSPEPPAFFAPAGDTPGGDTPAGDEEGQQDVHTRSASKRRERPRREGPDDDPATGEVPQPSAHLDSKRGSRSEVNRAAAQVALALVADVAALVAEWDREPAKSLKGGGLGVRELRRAAKLLGRPEDDTARLIELAGVAGLVAVDEVRGLALPTTAYDAWLARTPALRWSELASAWLASPIHLQLGRGERAGEKPAPPLAFRGYEARACSRRRLVLEVLVASPLGSVISGPGLVERAVWQAPALWEGGPAPAKVLAGCLLEEATVLGLLSGDILCDAARALAAGMIDQAATEVGLFAPPIVSEIVIQGDLTAVAAGTLEPRLRAELDLLADVESSGAATVYRFSEASLRRGFDAGRTGDEIAGLLAAHAAKGVPQPLSYMLADLGRRFGRMRVGSAASYLRSDDASLLAEVVRSRKVAKLRLRAIAPTAAVSSQAASVVTEALRSAGYLPAGEDPSGAIKLERRKVLRAQARTRRYDSTLAAYIDAHPGISAWSYPQMASGSATLDMLRRSTARGKAPPEPEDTASVIRELDATTGPATRPNEAGGGGVPGSRSGTALPASAYFAGTGGLDDSFGYDNPFGYDEPFGDEEDDILADDGDGIFDEDPALALTLALDELADMKRPTDIVRGGDAMTQVAFLAAVMEWPVRLSCLLDKPVQLSGYLSDVTPSQLSLEPFHADESVDLPMSTLEWIRVMTQAEEEATL